ncbi:uncharacterized protein EKO05_0003326 [Ascochyta rabiei]|uniref:uncharacterized protein n=1 Tax=Didymella rabiei TaxID=5454 RepID=UPI0022028B71|nr:uncharacterized protein EKO05_0003326 [Ascochyta rabiei]UPX12789.1 hypothetical protein EKO05_0003326 [Ascochyta rabiei]
MARIKKNQSSNTDTDTEAAYASDRDTDDGLLRKRRRTSTISRTNKKDRSKKPNSSTPRSLQLNKSEQKVHRRRNGRFTKHVKSRIAMTSNVSTGPESDADSRLAHDIRSSDVGGDRIGAETDQPSSTTQIRAAFEALMAALDGRTGQEEAYRPSSTGDDGALNQLLHQTSGSFTSKAAIDEPYTKTRGNSYLGKVDNPSDSTTSRQSLNTSHSIARTSTETPPPGDIHQSNPRHNQNTRVAAIVQWAQRTRTYNPTATLVNPFNLQPPTQTHPLSLAHHESISPSVGLVTPSYSPVPALAALYARHPAYAHLTSE